MARREAPAFSRGNAAHKEQWLRHLARHLPRLAGEKEESPAPVGKATAHPAPQRNRAAERWLRLFDN